MTASEGRHPPKDEDAPAGDPAESSRLALYLGRPLLLVFWTLVVWGTVYAMLFAFAVLTDGPSRAVARAVGGPGGAYGIVNLSLAAVSVSVWAFVGVYLWRRRRDLE
ncbi:MAG: hypothetical protein ABW221_24770 [Vicinamibacteria bacterium]